MRQVPGVEGAGLAVSEPNNSFPLTQAVIDRLCLPPIAPGEPCGYITNDPTCTATTAGVNFDQLAQIASQFRAEADNINRALVSALCRHILASGESLQVWANRFGVGSAYLFAVLSGSQNPSAYLWDQVRRAFLPPNEIASR